MLIIFLTIATLVMCRISSVLVDVTQIDRGWEDLVLAAPSVVNYLGLFMVLASRRDQALIQPAEYTVKYIKKVNSLRVTLLQISSEMEVIFKLTEDDLVRVRDSMNQISDHVKAGLLLIKTAPDNLRNELLPYTLRNVDRAAKEGVNVSKPTLDRFMSMSLLLEELVMLLSSTTSATGITDYLIEANIYANDIRTQWDHMIRFFSKLAMEAERTQQMVVHGFVEFTEMAQRDNVLVDPLDREFFIKLVVPTAIDIENGAHLLYTVATTYYDIISSEYMMNEITSINPCLHLEIESERIARQQQLWRNIVSQSVRIARLTQERQNQFANSTSNRQKEYDTYLQNGLPG